MDFKICVVGCGAIAASVHGPSYRKYSALHGGVRLAACCDVDEEKAAGFQKKFGFDRYYVDMATMLDTEKPDAVCLISPAHLTARLSTAIMERGYPLMLEKPPGLNGQETLAMIRAAGENRVPNQVAFNRRYMPVVGELRRRIGASFSPAEIQNIRYDLFRVDRRDRDFAETAIHGIDTVKYIAGSGYRQVAFHYQELPALGDGVANIFMECSFASGASAQLNFCPVAGITIERITVSAYNNTFFAELPVWNSVDAPGRLLHFDRNRRVLAVSGDDLSDGGEMFETNGFYAENAAFFEDIRAGRKPEGDIASALQAVEIADCIRRRKREYIAGEPEV